MDGAFMGENHFVVPKILINVHHEKLWNFKPQLYLMVNTTIGKHYKYSIYLSESENLCGPFLLGFWHLEALLKI